MNRSQRRFEERLRRPAGVFVGELGARADQRAYQEVLRAQMTEEANGAPIPPEVAARMTAEKPKDELWQVGVTVRRTKRVKYLGPMCNREAVEGICEAVNKQITLGQRRDWTKAEAFPMTRISEGAH